jgi:hypothetical protein
MEARARLQSVRLIVAEEGTSGLEVQALRPEGSADGVIAQSVGEPPARLARRAIRRILAFELSARRVERVTLLLSPRFDAEATAARVLVARALMTHSAASGGAASQLLLSAGNGAPNVSHQGSLRLMAALSEAPRRWPLPIQLHFAPGGSLVPTPRPIHVVAPRTICCTVQY